MNRPVEEPNQSLVLKLTLHEIEMLQWLTQKTGLNSPSELIEGFVADFTGSWRNGGSDEREYAFARFNRRGYVGEHVFVTEATK